MLSVPFCAKAPCPPTSPPLTIPNVTLINNTLTLKFSIKNINIFETDDDAYFISVSALGGVRRRPAPQIRNEFII